ncbi:putative reverse transcriptase domain-containing protein [Tanacetum coccineum]
MLHGLGRQIEKKEDGGLYFMDRIWVPFIGDVKTIIMDEVHAMRYFIHLGVDNMYYDSRDMYWWPCIKKDIATYVNVAESIGNTAKYEYGLSSLNGWTRLKAARDRQKSYADNRRKPLEFKEGKRVLLKVSPWKGAVRFKKKGKLAPRYVGPFEILERIGSVAYRLRLPHEFNGIHDTFHESNLKKCLADASLHV